jgi:hypothetical protein
MHTRYEAPSETPNEQAAHAIRAPRARPHNYPSPARPTATFTGSAALTMRYSASASSRRPSLPSACARRWRALRATCERRRGREREEEEEEEEEGGVSEGPELRQQRSLSAAAIRRQTQDGIHAACLCAILPYRTLASTPSTASTQSQWVSAEAASPVLRRERARLACTVTAASVPGAVAASAWEGAGEEWAYESSGRGRQAGWRIFCAAEREDQAPHINLHGCTLRPLPHCTSARLSNRS